MFCNRISKYLKNTIPAHYGRSPGARRQQPTASNPQPAAGKNLSFILLIILSVLLRVPAIAAEVTEKELPDAFTDVIHRLSSLGDRSTGTVGNQEAALYVKEKFTQLGYENLGSYRFSTPVMRHVKSTLTLSNRHNPIELRPISGNAVTPQTVGPPGISAPLVYAGRGEFRHLNGKQVADSIILMELDSGKNWLQAANLGARAVIYIDRGESPKQFFKEKFELSPLQFPRFWMSLVEAEKAFGDFENAPDGVVDNETQLFSQINWQIASSENIYCFVEGTDPDLKERLIMVEAFYDSTATVAGLSPGADEAVSIATLLELARFLKENPPPALGGADCQQRSRSDPCGYAGNDLEYFCAIQRSA